MCACGYVEGIRTKVGQNTIDVGAGGAGDVIRWSGTQAALAAGDIGMSALTSEDANGRPSAFVMSEARSLDARGWEPGAGIRRSFLVQQDGGLTTLSTVGLAAAPVTSGTATVLNVSTGQGQFINYASGAVLDNEAGVIAPTFDQTQRIYRPVSDFAIRTPATITLYRLWAGLFSATPMASATPSLHYMGFRFDTSAGDTTWRCLTDNGSGTPTNTDSTVTVGGTTSFRLRIVVDGAGSNVRFYVNGVLRATHTTTLPTDTQNLGYCATARTLSAAARSIRFGRIYVGQKAATLVS
jgi:hypothetical protein